MAASVYQSVKQAMQDLVAPQLEELSGKITALGHELGGAIATLRAEMRAGDEALRGEMRAEIAGLRGEMVGFRGELKGEIAALGSEVRRLDDKLTIALDLRERMVALETKLGA